MKFSSLCAADELSCTGEAFELAIEYARTAVAGDSGLQTIEAAEKSLIERTLAHFDNNVSRAADSLGISRGALYRRLDYYRIARPGD